MPRFDAYTAAVHGRWQIAAWVLLSGLLVSYGATLWWRLRPR